MMMNKKIYVACDVSNQKEILELLSKIHKEISGIKIGLQYITKHSPEDIKELGKFNKPIFYDGKFFDIKNTLVESIKSLKNMTSPTVWFLLVVVSLGFLPRPLWRLPWVQTALTWLVKP